MPAAAASPPLPDAIDLDRLPAVDELPAGAADAPVPPPGLVPAGDARSLRGRGRDGSPMFALVYRLGTTLVVASGPVGRRGHWHAVEYPRVSSASRAYAQACSELLSEGFVEFRR